MPPFKDENILILAPGSQTTLAQLGLPESFTPASHRFPTRMFLSPDGKTWEPHKIRSRKKVKEGGDVSMSGNNNEVDEEELVEDPEDDEGAVWPLKEGKIINLPAFFALLQHVYNTFYPNLRGSLPPILLVAQPCWTAKNHEDITQFIFEKFKTPGFCIIDSAIATTYAYAVANATVVDVGFEKVDVTAIIDFWVASRGRVEKSGGEAMTRRLVNLLKAKKFTRDMAEQLKKSPICEILPLGTALPGIDETVASEEVTNNPAAPALTGSSLSAPNIKINEPIEPVEVVEELALSDEKKVEDDGVLDIATIVTSGKTQDFLAKKEKEKVERAAAAATRKATRDAEKAEAATATNKPARLPNSKRPRAIFHYDEDIKEGLDSRRQNSTEPQPATGITSEETVAEKTADVPVDDTAVSTGDEAARREQQRAARKEERKKIRDEENPDRIRRDIEIGTERFQAAGQYFMDIIADTVYRTILSIDDVAKRQDAWDALIICGSGSKVRGFKDALISTLNNRYLVSPSSASMFMSELPSNLATPNGTGSMTPNTSFASPLQAPPTAGAVNPLLLAATTASNPLLNPNMPTASFAGQNHSSHSQTPTSIKIASPPSYFPEWKHFEEAVFLGSQVAAKVFFVIDQGQSKAFLTRLEFNEDGPTAIHQVGLAY